MLLGPVRFMILPAVESLVSYTLTETVFTSGDMFN
jgi:hypothetical protein